jgi:hypothetical protein
MAWHDLAVMAGCLAANDHAAGRLLAGCSWLLLLAGWLAGWLALHACGRRQYTTRQEDGCPDRA